MTRITGGDREPCFFYETLESTIYPGLVIVNLFRIRIISSSLFHNFLPFVPIFCYQNRGSRYKNAKVGKLMFGWQFLLLRS